MLQLNTCKSDGCETSAHKAISSSPGDLQQQRVHFKEAAGEQPLKTCLILISEKSCMLAAAAQTSCSACFSQHLYFLLKHLKSPQLITFPNKAKIKKEAKTAVPLTSTRSSSSESFSKHSNVKMFNNRNAAWGELDIFVFLNHNSVKSGQEWSIYIQRGFHLLRRWLSLMHDHTKAPEIRAAQQPAIT